MTNQPDQRISETSFVEKMIGVKEIDLVAVLLQYLSSKQLELNSGQQPDDLVTGLKNINRVLEIGIGADNRSMLKIAGLISSHTSPGNLVACDPDLGLNVTGEKSYTFLPIGSSQVALDVKNGMIQPFDLVFSKGVTSVGNLGMLSMTMEVEEINQLALGVVRDMADCVRSGGLVVVTTKFPDSMLFFSLNQIQRLGLQFEFGLEMSELTFSQTWVDLFRDMRILKENETPYSLLIMRKVH